MKDFNLWLDLERNIKLVCGPQPVFSDPDSTESGDPDIWRQARESPPLTQREENLKKFHVCRVLWTLDSVECWRLLLEPERFFYADSTNLGSGSRKMHRLGSGFSESQPKALPATTREIKISPFSCKRGTAQYQKYP